MEEQKLEFKQLGNLKMWYSELESGDVVFVSKDVDGNAIIMGGARLVEEFNTKLDPEDKKGAKTITEKVGEHLELISGFFLNTADEEKVKKDFKTE